MKCFMKTSGFRHLLFAMFFLFLPAGASAAEPPFSVGLGLEFASGKYGTGIRSESLYIPLSVAIYPTLRLDFSLDGFALELSKELGEWYSLAAIG